MKEVKKLWEIILIALILKVSYVCGKFGFDFMTILFVSLETIILVGISVILWYLTLKGGHD